MKIEPQGGLGDTQPLPVKKPPLKLESRQSIVLKSEEKGKTIQLDLSASSEQLEDYVQAYADAKEEANDNDPKSRDAEIEKAETKEEPVRNIEKQISDFNQDLANEAPQLEADQQ